MSTNSTQGQPDLDGLLSPTEPSGFRFLPPGFSPPSPYPESIRPIAARCLHESARRSEEAMESHAS